MTTSPDAPEPDGAVPWPSQARAWSVMGVFFVAAIIYYTDRFILNLLVDPIRAELHVSDTQVSLLQGVAFAVIYAFAGLSFGRFADVLPRRTVIMCGVTVWSIATAACGFAHDFGQLFTARIFVGLGEAAFAPAAVSMIGDLFAPRQRGTAIGVFVTGMSIGGGMAIVAGGMLLQWANAGLFHSLPVVGGLSAWRTVLVLLGLPGILALALLFTVSEPERRDRAAGPGSSLPLKAVVAGFVKLGPVLLPLYLAVAMATAGDSSLQNWTPALLSRKFGLTPGQIGAMLGAIAMATGCLGSIFGGMFSDHLAKQGGSRARLRAGLIAALLALVGAGMAFVTDSWQVMVLYAIWVLMTSVSETIGITMVQQVVPNEMRGIGASLVSFCNTLIGLGLGTTLTAVVTDHVYHDPRAVGLSMTTVALPAGLLSAFCFWLTYRAMKAREARGE